MGPQGAFRVFLIMALVLMICFICPKHSELLANQYHVSSIPINSAPETVFPALSKIIVARMNQWVKSF